MRMTKKILPALAFAATAIVWSGAAAANPEAPKPAHCEDKDHHDCKPKPEAGHGH
jgi:hypothetical protein